MKLLDDVKCDRYDSPNVSQTPLLENYLTEIGTIMNFKKPSTFYFGQGFFFYNSFIVKLTDALEAFLNNTNIKSDRIEIEDIVPSRPIKYTFLIRNPSELEHAKSLYKLNKYLIQPYFEKYKNVIENFTNNFDRVFLITGDVNDFSWVLKSCYFVEFY